MVEVAIVTQTFASEAAFEASHKRTVYPNDLTRKEINIASRLFSEKRKHLSEAQMPLRPEARAWSRRILSGTLAEISGNPQHGFEAMISAIIIGAWTAFEAAATDLWEESLNLRPKPLAIAAINNQLPKGRDEFGDSAGQRTEKLKLIEALIHEETGAIAKAGVLMRRTQKFDFNSLAGIEDAYVCIFGKSIRQLFSSRWFANLEVLEGVRNVLVHRGGYVDSRYRRRVEKNREGYKRFGLDMLKLHDRVPIDGAIASKLAESAVRSCNALLRFVGRWLVDHPSQPEL